MGNSTFTRLMPLILLIIILVIIITITFIYLYHNYYNKIPLSEKPIDCWYWKRNLGWKMSSVEKKRRQHQQYLVAAASAANNQQSRLLPHAENRENSTTESEEKELMLPSQMNQQNNQNKMLNEESNLTFQTLASTPINSQDEILKKPKRTPSSLSSIWKRFSTSRIVKSNKPTETVIHRQAHQLSKQQQILNFTDNGDYDDLPNTPPTIVKSTVPNFIDSSCQKHSYMASNLNRPAAVPTSLSSSASSNRPPPTKNNYLYFNYNNNKMNNFFNSSSQPTAGPVVGLASPVLTNSNNTTTEIVVSELMLNEESCNKMALYNNNLINDALHVISSMASSTPTQITPVSSSTKSSTNQKRLSGTEV